MTSLKTSIKTITYLSDTGCLEIQGASLQIMVRSYTTAVMRSLLFLLLCQMQLNGTERIRQDGNTW